MHAPPEDENQQYAIVLTYSADEIVMVMIYEGWKWDKVGDIRKCRLRRTGREAALPYAEHGRAATRRRGAFGEHEDPSSQSSLMRKRKLRVSYFETAPRRTLYGTASRWEISRSNALILGIMTSVRLVVPTWSQPGRLRNVAFGISDAA